VPEQEAGLALDPKRAGAHRRLGEMLARLGRHEEALAPLMRATAGEPDDPTLWSLIATCHERTDDPQKEAAALLEAVAKSPDDAPLLKRLGLAQRKIEQPREAITTLTRALALDPSLVDLELPLGEMHRAAGKRALGESDYAEAAEELAKARLYQRDDASLCVEHASALRALGRNADAAAAARRGTELAPDRAQIFYLLGELSAVIEEHAAARAAFERVIRDQPDRFEAQLGLGLACMKLGKAADAIEPLARAVRLDPEHSIALAQLGLAQQDEKRFADARDTFLRLAKVRPLDADPLRRLAACRLALGEDEGELDALTTLARLVPEELDVLEAIARCQGRLTRLEDSVASYERLLGLEPERMDARRALSLTYARLDRPDDVVRNGKTVLRARPEDQDLLLVFARAQSQKGRAAEAAEAAGTLVRLAPKSLDALWELAVAEVALGRDESAVATLERAFVLPEGPPRVSARLDELVRRRAAELTERGDHEAALACNRRARELVPDDPARPLAIARSLHALSRSQEALDVLRQNLKVHAAHGGSWLLLGRLYTEAGYAREAVDAYRKASTADLPDADRLLAFTGLGFACAEGDLRDEAITALNRAAELAPGDAKIKAKLADLYEAAGKRDESIQALLDLRTLRGLVPEEQRRLGLLCASTARHDEAAAALTAALAKWPGDASLLEPLSVALEALGRDADATRILLRLRDAAPGHPNASSRLGFAYARLGQHAEAASAFEIARAKEAPRAELLTSLVAAYTALADEPARRGALEALVKLAPNDLDAHRALGRAYDAIGKRDDALTTLTRADSLSRGADLDLRRRIAELHLSRAGDTSGANTDDLAKARRFTAHDPGLLLEVARAYASRKLGHEAAATAREVLVLEVSNVAAALLLGDVLAADRDARGAAEAYELALRHRVDAAPALVGAGLAYLALGRPEESVAMLRRAITVEPDRLEAQTTLAETLHALGRAGEAASSYREVVRLTPENADAWRTLGELLLGQGDAREAALALERAIDLRPADGAALLALATANERLGKSDDQLDALERAQRARPDDAAAAARYGLALAQAGNADLSITTLERAQSLDPSRLDVARRLGELLGQRASRRETEGNARGAEQDFAAALAIAPELLPLRLGLARAYRAQGKSHEALSAAEEATSRAPEDAAAWLLLGELRARLAHDTQAAEAFARAVRYDGSSF
ncbi:MAG: tetratricopeptide repeat protein, partial [Minicystis sp.]